ncbi:Aldo/keto reductase family [Prochlorococcus marinus str. MIT 9515]|uniref:Aldo/keto reductase family n=1 Tax=Prochlorococcus marinus (strain MIT 9515) TaxID=167542 RepID=A2BVA1_PROM5|nr:aldo/keto reductase [Prochlorococcus marinus]ABM71712.1 Aldo/keto reductase family [Prochlorococcus marinus str. MIT 9515]
MIIDSQKRLFGKGCNVSLFTLGTMRATENLNKMYSLIKRAHQAGINHLETAASYGKAEILIGEVLNKLENSEKITKKEWIITTKVLPKGDFNYLKKNFKNSLKNLKLKKIHNLAIHGINLDEHLDWVLNGEGVKFLQWLIKNDLVDQVGFSSHGSYKLIEKAINCEVFSFCNLHLHFLDQSKISLAQLALKKKMGVLAISPADKGGRLYAPSDTLLKASAPYHPLALAYRFLLSKGITTLSLGASKIEDFYIAEKLINSSQKLTSSEINALKNIEKVANEELKSSKCEQCRSCLPCPSEIPIPEILRLRNISLGYGQIEFAKERYNLIGRAGHWWEEKNASFCLECNECVPKCPSELNIPELLKQTHNLLVEKPKKRLWG